MADNEDESNNASSLGGAAELVPGGAAGSQTHVTSTSSGSPTDAGDVTPCGAGEGSGPAESLTVHAASVTEVGEVDGAQTVIGQIVTADGLTSYVQTSDAAIVEGAECATVSGDLLSALAPATTIIYVQPDGSFVESSGLSAEEQQQLIEHLSKQQLVQVTGSEAARVLEQVQPAAAATATVKPATVATIDVQQVIDHVNKSQAGAQAEPSRSHTAAPKILQRNVATVAPQQPASYITLEPGNLISPTGQITATIQPQPFAIVQNASQQLQSVAKQVALQQSQNGAHLLHQKPAESIHIQVQAPSPAKQEAKPRQATPITILQPQSLPVSQSLVKVSTVGTVSTPQIIHITPVPGQQQYFLQNPGEPPIQLLLQKPAPVVSSISVPIVRKVQAPPPASSPVPVKSPAAKPAPVASNPTLLLTPTPPTTVSSPSTKVPTPPAKATNVVTKAPTQTVEKEKPRVKNRQKKPQKIQTRSGRVSRPPKYKVKDYKFIKTEDLAESHQSDSDDYSEISVEDEEGDDSKKKAKDDGLSLRSKGFKCETCEKSYIGLAGLNRHYRLYPAHDKSQTSPPAERDSKPKEEPTVTEPAKTNVVKAAATQKVQADSTRQIEPRRPGRPKGSGKGSLPKRLGRKPKRGRRGRPPKHHPATAALTAEQQAQKRRTRLTEFIQQYDDEDLMETVLPRLAKVMTVWEFVLMKVETGHSSKQQFPSVYREFEELHGQVKKLAQEHFSIAPASRPAIEVNNMEVLKSLGISDPNALMLPNSTQAQQGTARVNQGMKSLRNMENTKMLPPAKRFKMENCGGEKSDSSVNQNGVQKDECSDGSALLRENQLLLTRVDNSNSQGGSDASALSSTTVALEERTEADEPMDIGEAPVDSEAAKPQEDPDKEISEVLNSSGNVDIADEMKQLEQVLSTETECKSTPQEPTLQGDTVQTDCSNDGGAEEQSGASQTLQPEVETPVFIQTAEGLVRQSAEELASKGIVIVNGPDGTTMHIEAPEGVPLETVHALLGIETERKT